MIFAKCALGFGGAVVLAGAYAFHDGVIRISVDEHRLNGDHTHLIVPAAVVPLAARFIPQENLREAAANAGPWLPAIRAAAKELKKFPEAELLEVVDGGEHVQLRTRNNKLLIDVESPQETVHVSCPLATIQDVAEGLEEMRPGS